jgi:AcrR family transcriptional regulator
MPPKVEFTREKILENAFILLREEGPQGITARNVAERMGGSTQPIYRNFASKAELEKAVAERAKEYAVDRILEYSAVEAEPFFGIGMGYLTFAREEPELFRHLFLSGRYKLDFVRMEYPLNKLLQRMKGDRYLSGLPEERLRRLLTDMWIYTHGLSSIVQSLPDSYDIEEFLRKRLLETGGTLIGWEHISVHAPETVAKHFGPVFIPTIGSTHKGEEP